MTSSDGIWFNIEGRTHSLRILGVDEKAEHVIVYEAMVDTSEYIYFEAERGASEWAVIGAACEAYVRMLEDDEEVNRRKVKTRWSE